MYYTPFTHNVSSKGEKMPKKRFTLVIDEELNNFLNNEKWKARLSKNQLIVKILSEYASQHKNQNKNTKEI